LANIVIKRKGAGLRMGVVRESTPGIRPYDFKRSRQLNRGEVDALTSILAGFWRAVASFLSTYLRTPVQIQAGPLEQIDYELLLEGLKPPTVLAVFSEPPAPGHAIIECAPTVALGMIDRALGGPGQTTYQSRQLTEIEQIIFRRILERMLVFYRESFEPVINLEPKVTVLEHSPAFTQIAGEGDLILVQRQTVILDGQKGWMTLAWPYVHIHPLAEAAVRYIQARDGLQTLVEAKPEEMRRHVERLPVEAAVILGRTEITLGEFSHLKVGDAIVLKNRFDQPLIMRMSNRNKFQVLPGRVGSRLAVRVIGRAEGPHSSNP